jgi:hypothetical protein
MIDKDQEQCDLPGEIYDTDEIDEFLPYSKPTEEELKLDDIPF